MAQPSNERRSLFLVASIPCPLCESWRVTRIGRVEDADCFRCANCDKVFTIHLAARAGDAARDIYSED